MNAFSEVTHVGRTKRLSKILQRQSGRNQQGKITVRHRGGGEKRFYRMVDFLNTKWDVQGVVETVEYDPNRSARIARVRYADGEQRYILAPLGLQPQATIITSKTKVEPNPGNRMPLKYIPTGMTVYNLELFPGRGGTVVRSAGSGAIFQSLEDGRATVKLPSGEVRIFSEDCLATVGSLSNPDHGNVRYGKAGRMRHRGIRPSVTGKSMNPVDHPHGGGEGHQPIGLRSGPKTPWGKHALGVKTRKSSKKSNRYIVKRRP